MNFFSEFCFIILFLSSCICTAKKTGLQIITQSKPDDCSTTAENGDVVAVHYTGKLENGKIFDSSIAAKRDPIKFQLGMGKVIKGWEKGILGMCEGEKRQLVIPPELAYGSSGVQGVIPPDATLMFETELITLEKNTALSPNNIGQLLNFAIWPTIVLIVIAILYKRMAAADEKLKSEKSQKKLRKKKH